MKRHTLVFCCLAVLGISASAPAVDGHAVSVCWRYCVQNWAGCVPEVLGTNSYFWRGKIIRVDINNNAPTRCDTIFRGLAQYPALSFDGSRVAFYRYDCTVSGSSLSGSCNTGKISVVDKDGNNLRDLVSWSGSLTKNFADNECALDWPAGEWVYYVKPPLTTSQIWRVNVSDPSRNELVGTYTGNPSDGDVFYLRRWSLSVDAKYAGGQFKDGTCGQNIIHAFASPIGNPCSTKPTGGTFPGCNGALSAGGNFYASYIGGCHNSVVISEWNHETNAATWSIKEISNDAIKQALGRDMAVCGEMIRWSANSEKWVLQGTGWKAHAEDMRYGGNQLLVNWIDNVGFLVTSNPALPRSPEGWAVEGQTYYQNDPGDFFVSGGPAGSYETRSGTWVSVDVVTAASRRSLAPNLVNYQMDTPGRGIELVDMRGRVMPASALRQGLCLVRLAGNKGSGVQKILVAR